MGDGFLRAAEPRDLQTGSPGAGVFKITDPHGFLEMPVWKFGDMLSFAKA